VQEKTSTQTQTLGRWSKL